MQDRDPSRLPCRVEKSAAKKPTPPAASPSTAPGKRAKTAAEEAFERTQKERRLKQKTAHLKSHKEKVAEFNEKLSKLSEHYDIPKVGPG